jgi:alpha-tubulin suppressor-like RCC1 family protein
MLPATLGKPPAGVSPSSTMDMLPMDCYPKVAAPPSHRASLLLAATAASEQHALQVDAAGGVLVCGGSALQEEGETFVAHLGLGEEWGAPVAAPTPLAANPELGRARAVAAGSLHSLVLSKTGQVWSCGAGWEGPLGHGDEASLCVPTRISALNDVSVSMIAAGRAHSLAISEDGALYSWGWGKCGQLGHGDRVSVHVPRRVEAIAPPLVALQVSGGAWPLFPPPTPLCLTRLA